MKQVSMSLNDLFTEIILGISKNLNKKALKNTLDEGHEDYNEALRAYYLKAHHVNPDTAFSEFDYYEFTEIDPNNDMDDYKYLKGFTNGKIYKKPYDYRRGHLEPIKQKDTGLIEEYNNGFVSGYRWRFNVYKYLETNNIIAIDNYFN